MVTFSVLPDDVEASVEKCIETKFAEHKLRDSFQNRLLREDVLDMLDRFCTVVYYPLYNEENNGFQAKNIPFADGTFQNFVFINTALTLDRQVFTAAHELGHLWEVDTYVITELSLCPEDVGLTSMDDLREAIVNRFAATLLIPRDAFVQLISQEIKELLNSDGTITVDNLLKLVVFLMYQFFVPMKAIVYRFVELKIFKADVAETLLGYGKIAPDIIDRRVKGLISDLGYVKLHNRTNKKWIDGLAEMLDAAEQKRLVPQSKIDNLRKAFALTRTIPPTIEMTEAVSFVAQEGFDE